MGCMVFNDLVVNISCRIQYIEWLMCKLQFYFIVNFDPRVSQVTVVIGLTKGHRNGAPFI